MNKSSEEICRSFTEVEVLQYHTLVSAYYI